MLHVITLLHIAPGSEDDLLRSLYVWQSRVRRVAPGLIATDVLRHAFSPLFHCHDFCQDEASYLQARQSPAIAEFLRERERMGCACLPLGPFAFAKLIESRNEQSLVAGASTD